jgi:hypothetical protein
MNNIILERLVFTFDIQNIYLSLIYAAILCLSIFFNFNVEYIKFTNYLLILGSFFINLKLVLDMYFGYALYNLVLYIVGSNNKKLSFDNFLHEALVLSITYLNKCINNYFLIICMKWTIRDYLITDLLLYIYKLWPKKITAIIYFISFIYFRLYSQAIMLYEMFNITLLHIIYILIRSYLLVDYLFLSY